METLGISRRLATARGFPIVLAVGGILLSGCTVEQPRGEKAAGSPQSAAAPNVEADKQAIVALERDWAAALVRKDVDWYSRNAAADFRTILSGGGMLSRAQVIAHVRNSPPARNLALEESDVRIFGNAAVATVTQSFERANGKPGRLRITDVWVRSEKGQWMVVQSHESSLAPSPPADPAN